MGSSPGDWDLLLHSVVGSFDVSVDVTHVTLKLQLVPAHPPCVGILEKVLEASLVQVLHSGCHSRELLSGRVRVEHVPF